jgi:hypothetical protein
VARLRSLFAFPLEKRSILSQILVLLTKPIRPLKMAYVHVEAVKNTKAAMVGTPN